MQYVVRATFATNDVAVARPSAAILAEAASGIVFDNDKISNVGATGIDYHYGVTNSAIVNCTVTDICGNGISVAKFVNDSDVDYHEPYNPEDEREICDGVIVVNNEIYRVGLDYECAVAVAAGYPKNILIANNTIAYAPYSGISVGFGWTTQKNAMSGNRILCNEIYSVAEILCDAGGIYTLSEQTDSELWGNYIHDIKVPSWADYGTSGLYFDEGTGGYYITHNVLENAYGITFHVAGFNKSVNNFVNESGKVTSETATAVKENAGVRDSVDLSLYDAVPSDEILVEGEMTEVFGDDFESYETGRFYSDKWIVDSSQKSLVRVVDDNGNKVIELTSTGANTKLYADIDLDANVTQFDFCFTDALGGWEGMYNVLRDSGTVYTANINPAFERTIRLETKGSGEVGLSKPIVNQTWYTCKTLVYENVMYVKVWRADKSEPDEWDVLQEMKDAVNGDAEVGLEFYADGRKSMYIDNVVVYGFVNEDASDTDVTDTDTPDTAVTTAPVEDSETAADTSGIKEDGCGTSVTSALPIVSLLIIMIPVIFRKKQN